MKNFNKTNNSIKIKMNFENKENIHRRNTKKNLSLTYFDVKNKM